MIPPSFKWFSTPRGDQPNFLSSQSVDNNDEPPFYHADDREPIFTVIFASIEPIDGKRVRERDARSLEGDAMFGVILGCLPFIPLECIVMHDIRRSRSSVKRQAQGAPKGIASPCRTTYRFAEAARSRISPAQGKHDHVTMAERAASDGAHRRSFMSGSESAPLELCHSCNLAPRHRYGAILA
jgi:hypothetical protein